MKCPSCGAVLTDADSTCDCGYQVREDEGQDGAPKADDAVTDDTASDDVEKPGQSDAPNEVSAGDTGKSGSPEEEPPKRKKKRKKRRRKKRREEPALAVAAQMHAMHIQGVVLLLVLNSITCGIYGAYWYLMRQPFIDSLNSGSKIGRTVPTMILVGSVINTAIALFNGVLAGSGDPLPEAVGVFSQLLGLGVGIASLILAFNIRTIMLQHCRRYEPGYTMSAAATFFFNILYLQYKINRMKTHAEIDEIVQEFA